MNGMTFARICGHKLTIRRALYTASTIKTSHRTIKTNLSFPQINSNKKYLFKTVFQNIAAQDWTLKHYKGAIVTLAFQKKAK
jgi:hypothetical protein